MFLEKIVWNEWINEPQSIKKISWKSFNVYTCNSVHIGRTKIHHLHQKYLNTMFGELQVGITLYSWEHTLCKTNKQIPTEFKSILCLRVYVSIQLLDLTPSTGSICHNRNKCSFTLMNQVMNILFFFTQKQNRSGGKKDKNIKKKKN